MLRGERVAAQLVIASVLAAAVPGCLVSDHYRDSTQAVTGSGGQGGAGGTSGGGTGGGGAGGSGGLCPDNPRSCKELLGCGQDTDGLREIVLQGARTNVYCDQTRDGGGWILIGTNTTDGTIPSEWKQAAPYKAEALLSPTPTSVAFRAHKDFDAIASDGVILRQLAEAPGAAWGYWFLSKSPTAYAERVALMICDGGDFAGVEFAASLDGPRYRPDPGDCGGNGVLGTNMVEGGTRETTFFGSENNAVGSATSAFDGSTHGWGVASTLWLRECDPGSGCSASSGSGGSGGSGGTGGSGGSGGTGGSGVITTGLSDVRHLQAHGGYIYWASGVSVYRVPAGGGAAEPQITTPGQTLGFAISDDFLLARDMTTTALRYCATSDCLGTFMETPFGVSAGLGAPALDGTLAYLGNPSTGTISLTRIDLVAGSVDGVVSGPCNPAASYPVIDGQALYWLTPSALCTADLHGPTAHALSPPIPANALQQFNPIRGPTRLVVAASRVAWCGQDSTWVYDTGPADVVQTSLACSGDVAAAPDGSLYATNGNAVVKLAPDDTVTEVVQSAGLRETLTVDDSFVYYVDGTGALVRAGL